MIQKRLHPRRIGQEFELGILASRDIDLSQLKFNLIGKAGNDKKLMGPTAYWGDGAEPRPGEKGIDLWSRHSGLCLTNGARFYYDDPLLEYCTSPAKNALEALAQVRAADRIVSRLYNQFIRNNFDVQFDNNPHKTSHTVTFGNHLNFWVARSVVDNVVILLPHLATMQIFSGAGVISDCLPPFDKSMQYEKGATFSISLRPLFMQHFSSTANTTQNRSIITKGRLGDKEDAARLHIISADATMHDIPEFLKLFTTDMVLRAIEEGIFEPHLELFAFERMNFLESYVETPPLIDDMHSIARCMGRWPMKSMRHSEMRSALDVQVRYYEITKRAFGTYCDSVTKLGFQLWGDVLQKLSRLTGEVDADGFSKDDLAPLFGHVDWATKKYLFDAMIAEDRNIIADLLARPSGVFNKEEEEYLQKRHGLAYLAAQDLEYHILNSDRNISGAFGQSQVVRSLLTEQQIRHYDKYPPRGRGELHELAARIAGTLGRDSKELIVDWSVINVKGRYWRTGDPNSDYRDYQEELRNIFRYRD